MSNENKITVQEIRQMQKELAELKQARQDKSAKSQLILIGRLGRELYPDHYVRETIKSAILVAPKDNNTFGETESVVTADIDIPQTENTFLWAVDFSLYKPNKEGNEGLRNTFLPISGETVALYPHTTPVAEIDWRYTGRDFEWAMGENSGKSNLQGKDYWRPSSDCRRHPYGYVLAEDMELRKGTKFNVSARPLGGINMWLPDGDQQEYTLTVHLRCYEMIPHDVRKRL